MTILNLIYQVIILICIFFVGALAYGVWKSTDISSIDNNIEPEDQKTERNKYTDYIIYKNLRKK